MTHTWRNADISNKVLNKRFSFFLGKLVRLLCIFCRKFLPFSSFKRTMVRYIHTYYDRLDKLLQSSMFATYEPLFRTLLLPCLHCAFPIANSVIESRSSSQRHQRGGGEGGRGSGNSGYESLQREKYWHQTTFSLSAARSVLPDEKGRTLQRTLPGPPH